jgi:hypothetical protein
MVAGPRLLLRRASVQPLVLGAAFATILLATALLCALALYGSSAADSGVRKALGSAPASVVATRVVGGTSSATFGVQDRALRDAVRAAYEQLAVAVHGTAQSASYALPNRTSKGEPDLATFHYFSELERHATLVNGSWPATSRSGRVSTAVIEPVAKALALRPGQTLRLTSRLTQEPVDIVVSGVFRPRDPASAYWMLDPYHGKGVQHGGYRTYGPFAVTRSTFQARLADDGTVTWILLPDFDRMTAGDIQRLRSASHQLASDLRRSPTIGENAQVGTGLPSRLEQIDRALIATRSIMLVPMLQLILLAVYALLLTARLLDDHRRGEHALMRARGASSRQLAGLAVREGLLLTVPAALLAPPIAALGLRVLSQRGGSSAVGLRLGDRIDLSTWLGAACVAVLCGLALTAPLLRRGETFVSAQSARGRPNRRSVLQRTGADLALLAVAALGYWELRRYDTPIVTSVGDGLRIDPLLVAAPVLALLAGGLLALRVLPVLSRVAERPAARSRRLGAPLGTWQVSRRPLRQSGPMLLLALALAIGTFSAVYSASWTRAQDDQADFKAGAELRVTPAQTDTAIPGLGQHAGYAGVPDVHTVAPVLRTTTSVGARNLEATVLGVDAGRASDLLMLRRDLAPHPLRHLLRPLLAGRVQLRGIPLPGHSARLAIDARLTSSVTPSRLDGVDVSATVQDGDGVVHTLPLGTLAPDSRSHTLTTDLAGERSGMRWVAEGPLHLIGFVLDYLEPLGYQQLAFGVERIRTADRTGGPAAVTVQPPAGTEWRPGPITPDIADDPPDLESVGLRNVSSSGRDLVTATVSAGIDGSSGFFPTPALVEVTTDDRPGPASEPLPAVVDDAFLQATSLKVGDVLQVGVNTLEMRVRVAGSVRRWPTVSSVGGGILIDLPSLASTQYRGQALAATPNEWWLGTAGRPPAAAARFIAAHPGLAAEVVDRDAVARALRDDPLGIGVREAMLAGFAAAVILAALGFALHAGTSARERRTEFALLRALGAGPREMTALLATEQLFLIGGGSVAGLTLGIATARLIVPLVMLSGEATRVVPPVDVIAPWATLALLTAAIVGAVMISTIALAAAAIRRSDLASVLRAGADR